MFSWRQCTRRLAPSSCTSRILRGAPTQMPLIYETDCLPTFRQWTGEGLLNRASPKCNSDCFRRAGVHTPCCDWYAFFR